MPTGTSAARTVRAAGVVLAAVCLAASVAGTPVATAAPITVGEPVGATDGVVPSRVAFTFADEDIDESSGLVDAGSVVHTVNDSGDGPVVYTVAKATGETVATTTYSDSDVADVEALAPGSDGTVWAADIGDNNRFRSYVAVYRVPVPAGIAGDREVGGEQYKLVYPGAAHDAETLLRHPRTGRLFVVSKSIRGASVYAAPASLDAEETNPMTEVASVPGVVTDGAFLPDGGHVLLRSYGGAAVYTFPGFAPVGRMRLPAQEQGEGLAVGTSGEILISTEGPRSDVLVVRLPPDVRAAMAAPPTAPAASSAGPTPDADDPAASSGEDENDGAWYAAAALSVVVGGYVLVRLFRPRSRRTP